MPSVTITLMGIFPWAVEGSERELVVRSFLGGLEKGRNRARRCAREESFREKPVAELDVALLHLISSVPQTIAWALHTNLPAVLLQTARLS